MGMFDTIYYEGKEYQTKDTPMQCLDVYEIRGDELWIKTVEREWVNDETALLGGYLKRMSEDWEPLTEFDGSIEFYDDKTNYLALFWEGKMIRFKELNYERE